MTEPRETNEKRGVTQQEQSGGEELSALAAAAAQLMRRTIERANPASMDFKDIKQLTGALKDLAELMGQPDEDENKKEGGIVIRVEGDGCL